MAQTASLCISPDHFAPGVLAKICQQGSRLLLIAPHWPTRVWFSDLTSLINGSPWVILVRRDLRSKNYPQVHVLGGSRDPSTVMQA